MRFRVSICKQATFNGRIEFVPYDHLCSACYSIFHPVGTCRMGPDAGAAVVDHRLLVHGLASLRIADASVFPSVTSGNTNAPAMMVGEMAAAAILGS